MNVIEKSILTTALLGFAGSCFAAAPVMNWKIDSSAPLDQITFGITIDAAAPVDEFYFSNQFGFTGGGGIGYTGIQPTKNTQGGKRRFRVIFSSFRADTSTNYENCKGGADGGKNGATCRLDIPGELGDTFLLNVKKEGRVLTGTVLNQNTGREDVIGQWEVGASAGNLAGSQLSFIENYKMNNPKYKMACNHKAWPYYEVKFLPPAGNDGEAQGSISTLSRGSDVCRGAITWVHDETGTLVKGGFK